MESRINFLLLSNSTSVGVLCAALVGLLPGCSASRWQTSHSVRLAASSVAVANESQAGNRRQTVGHAQLADQHSSGGGDTSPLSHLQADEDPSMVSVSFVAVEPGIVESSNESAAGQMPIDSDVGFGNVNKEDQRSWTLADLETVALQNNPAIMQAVATIEKATGYRNQAGLRPNPVIGYQGSQLWDAGTDQHVVFVEQDFVRGEKLQRNQRVLNQEIRSQLWEAETQRFRVLTDVRRNYYAALAAQRRMTLASEFEIVAIKGVAVAEARVNAKEGTRPEVLQAEIQLGQVQLLRRQAVAAFEGAWQQLMSVAGIPHVRPGRLEGDLSIPVTERDWDVVQSSVLSSSPELQGARARLARSRANLDRQQVQATPNLSLTVAAGQDNGTGAGMVNTQVGVPLPIFNQNQGNIRAAYAEVCRASHDVNRTELAIQSRLAEARRSVEAAAAAVNLYKQEILPRAQETLQLAEQAYAAGEFDFLQVLIARRTFFDTNMEYVAAQMEYAQATALVDGSVLSGGLDSSRDVDFDSGLRDQSFNGQ